MALLSVIRSWHFRDQLSIREISRRTGLSRNTVRKYLRDDTVEPAFKVHAGHMAYGLFRKHGLQVLRGERVSSGLDAALIGVEKSYIVVQE